MSDRYFAGVIVGETAQITSNSAQVDWGWKRGRGHLGRPTFINLLGEEIKFIGQETGKAGGFMEFYGRKLYLARGWNKRTDRDLITSLLNSGALKETKPNS